MNMPDAVALLRQLQNQERKIIYKSEDGVEVIATQTGKFSPNDFAVGLVLPGQEEFRPTHIRLLIDLYIKKLSNPDGANDLFIAIEKINDGEDPEKLYETLLKHSFTMKFDSPEVNLYYAQLLLIEQDFNFSPPSKKVSRLNPPREYLMRFIRWVASGDDLIDRVIFAGAGRKYPAPERYSKRLIK
jgi:hypothetical protein